IIGILAAVLIPNLLSARNRANDTAAQAYLREAVTIQEIYQVDHNLYTSDADELEDLGLKESPTSVDFEIHSAGETNYCMSSTHSGGSDKVFYATADTGLSEEDCS